jgi:hypothetical protein
VVIATGDDSLVPGSQIALNTSQRQRALRLMEQLTSLTATANGIEFFYEEFQHQIVGNGVLLLKVDKVLCQSLFTPELYDNRHQGKDTGAKQKDKKLKLDNFYGQPIPGTLVHHGDLVENNENIWFEIQVSWPKDERLDMSTYQTETMVTPGHNGNVALLKVEWEFERIEALPQRSLPPPVPLSGGVQMPSEAPNEKSTPVAPDSQSGGVSMSSSASKAPSSPMPAPAKRIALRTDRTDVAEVKHALALEAGESSATFRVTAHARFDACFEPATFTTDVVVRSTTEMLATAKFDSRAYWQDEGQQLGYLPKSQLVIVSLLDAFSQLNEALALTEKIPFEICSLGSVFFDEWIEAEYPRWGFGRSHIDHGWGCAFRGAGHDRLVSRRWLDHGPWRVIRRDKDTTFIQFHDLDITDPAEAYEQAKVGYQRMGIDPIGGFIQGIDLEVIK